ncbi:PREDICTED: nuclear-pore anchor-like [Camelina sativa]|uniref:Nuclear-pore anchor-like n=1 Tax=Camelina sativa TaxID=90675 RepID=A0ABM0WLH3_CAMSA|nr:PREDICTED: nuclear-pore anchor-like [Camelina sativa]
MAFARLHIFSQLDEKLQDSVSERSNMEKYIMELKANLKRHERENSLSQKDISDLQKQVTILLKECRDVQLRCGAARDNEEVDPHHFNVEIDMESEVEQVISEHFISGLYIALWIGFAHISFKEGSMLLVLLDVIFQKVTKSSWKLLSY